MTGAVSRLWWKMTSPGLCEHNWVWASWDRSFIATIICKQMTTLWVLKMETTPRTIICLERRYLCIIVTASGLPLCDTCSCIHSILHYFSLISLISGVMWASKILISYEIAKGRGMLVCRDFKMFLTCYNFILVQRKPVTEIS